MFSDIWLCNSSHSSAGSSPAGWYMISLKVMTESAAVVVFGSPRKGMLWPLTGIKRQIAAIDESSARECHSDIQSWTRSIDQIEGLLASQNAAIAAESRLPRDAKAGSGGAFPQ